MIQLKRNTVIALCSDGKPPVVRQSFVTATTSGIGFYNMFFPEYYFINTNPKRSNQQSILIPVSAGNDLRVSTMRPDPFTSAGLIKRGSKYRGFPQLISQTFE